MTDKDAIAIVRRHQEWRRGAEIPFESIDVKKLGLAIDRVIELADKQATFLDRMNRSTYGGEDDND